MTAPLLDIGASERDRLNEAFRWSAPDGWLARSQQDPAAFWESLLATVDASSASVQKSRPLHRYDLYHDVLVRHLRSEVPAFVESGARGGQKLGFRALGLRATRRAAAWQLAGLAEGQTVCIVRHAGSELVVSLLAALKGGHVVSLVPPLGPRFVSARVAALAPAGLDADEATLERVRTLGAAVLPQDVDHDVTHDLERSVGYLAGATAARLFDPASDTPAVPRPVTADALYLCALRDGAMTLGLRRGDAVASIGAPLLESLPALLLASMVMGASYHHVTVDDVRGDPDLLAGLSLRAVGVSVALRELILARPTGLGERWRSWFRNPAESDDVHRWQDFVVAAGLQDVPASNLKWDPAHGGCTLFSPARPGRAHCEVLPAAGVPYAIADLSTDRPLGPGERGRFAPIAPGTREPVPTPSIVVPLRGSWMFAASWLEGRRGRRYLTGEVLGVLEGLPGLDAASVCIWPAAAAERRVDLLLFTGARVVDQAALVAEVSRRIATELGDEQRPDQMVCYRLQARRAEDGTVDHGWCRHQHVTGELARRDRDEVQRALTELRAACFDRGRTSTT